MAETRYFAERAWVNGSWACDVLLVAGADGHWLAVQPGSTAAQREGAQVLAGPVVPGLVNGHSHAFQRAIAGLTERSGGVQDDFWSWRERMYAAALRVSPEQLQAVAAFLYTELLQAGFTQVCEFHYLHQDTEGRPYANPQEMSLALVRAARQAGIGLTLLPTLYMRSGFVATDLRVEQRRFASTPGSVLRIAESVRREAAGDPRVTAGVALHSLRAVDEGALLEVAVAAAVPGLPVHIHIAEQQQEVDDCVRQHGARPIEWLLARAPVDARWNLVHATRATRAELSALRATGAAVVLCPATEANLGDGRFDLPTWLQAGGTWSVGTDSHVTRSWTEELRLLEYSQRLALRQRNVAARASGNDGTAAALFQGALAGGSAAAGLPLGGLAAGQRADFCVIDPNAPAVLGLPPEHLLDGLVFSSPSPAFKQVVVAGEPVALELPRGPYLQAMRALWDGEAVRT